MIPILNSSEVKLIETKTNEIFYDKLTFIYLEMPKFNKSEAELVSHFDKWLYLLKNLNRFTEIPAVLQERIFRKLFTIAEVSNLNEEEMKTYEASLKDKRDWKNALDTATAEGMEKGMEKDIEKGMEKERIEVVKRLKQLGVDEVIISQATQLSVEEIRKIVID